MIFLSKRSDLLIAIGAGILLIFSAYFLGRHMEQSDMKKIFYDIRQIRLPNEAYPLVSRLIATELPSAIQLGFYTDLHSQIKNFTDKELKTSTLTNISFYFRDLNTGMWFGINENKENIPASLFKLPIAMAYYKDYASDHGILDKEYIYTPEIAAKLDTSIGLEKSKLVTGNAYRVSDLIERMLADSDNGAKNLLSEHINLKTLNTLFDLVELAGPAQNSYYLSAKEYALFLRVLYNGTYLGQERSQAILSILSRTNFDKGMREAVPSDITVAHKFGSVNLIDKNSGRKKIGFRDCGIVYYPQKPFVLCFMLEGDDQAALAKDVNQITKYVLEYMRTN